MTNLNTLEDRRAALRADWDLMMEAGHERMPVWWRNLDERQRRREAWVEAALRQEPQP